MATVIEPTSTGIVYLPPTPDGRVRFSRAAYLRMFEVDALDPDKRFELLDGEIIMSPPIGPEQGGLISRLNRHFGNVLPETMDCRVQLPIVVDDHSEPEPDLAVVRRRSDDYLSSHPSPGDALLLIEVSQSSLARDRGQKMLIYARSGIAEYWIIDVEHRTVIVHRGPGPLGYSDIQQFKAPAQIAVLAAPECHLDLSWLFH